MLLIQKWLWKEKFHYYSDKSIDVFKAEISELITNTRGWNFSVNLTGILLHTIILR